MSKSQWMLCLALCHACPTPSTNQSRSWQFPDRPVTEDVCILSHPSTTCTLTLHGINWFTVLGSIHICIGRFTNALLQAHKAQNQCCVLRKAVLHFGTTKITKFRCVTCRLRKIVKGDGSTSVHIFQDGVATRVQYSFTVTSLPLLEASVSVFLCNSAQIILGFAVIHALTFCIYCVGCYKGSFKLQSVALLRISFEGWQQFLIVDNFISVCLLVK